MQNDFSIIDIAINFNKNYIQLKNNIFYFMFHHIMRIHYFIVYAVITFQTATIILSALTQRLRKNCTVHLR